MSRGTDIQDAAKSLCEALQRAQLPLFLMDKALRLCSELEPYFKDTDEAFFARIEANTKEWCK